MNKTLNLISLFVAILLCITAHTAEKMQPPSYQQFYKANDLHANYKQEIDNPQTCTIVNALCCLAGNTATIRTFGYTSLFTLTIVPSLTVLSVQLHRVLQKHKSLLQLQKELR